MTPTSFRIGLAQWPYEDGGHIPEEIHWMAVERGRWDLPGGGSVEAGTAQAQDATGQQNPQWWTSVAYSEPISEAPVVLSTVASNNESDPVTTRIRNVATTGFQVRLQEEEASTNGHAFETVNWVAWEPGIGQPSAPQIDYEEQYTYDEFGNMTSVAHTWPDGSNETRTFAIVPSTNRLSTASYDTAGDLLSGGTGSYTYDAVHNLQSIGQNDWTYFYDAFDDRVGTAHFVGPGYVFDETYTIRSAGGQVLREYARSSDMDPGELNWITDYVWRGGGLLATSQPGTSGDQITHYHLDHLGTPRLVTDDTGQTLSRHTYFPYGTEATDPSDPQQASFRFQFTGQERDLMNAGTLDDLDYMHARSYSSHMGRFLQVDPILGSVGNPQSWNRYAYVLGSPVNYMDPTGLDTECTWDQGSATETCTDHPIFDFPVLPTPVPAPGPIQYPSLPNLRPGREWRFGLSCDNPRLANTPLCTGRDGQRGRDGNGGGGQTGDNDDSNCKDPQDLGCAIGEAVHVKPCTMSTRHFVNSVKRNYDLTMNGLEGDLLSESLAWGFSFAADSAAVTWFAGYWNGISVEHWVKSGFKSLEVRPGVYHTRLETGIIAGATNLMGGLVGNQLYKAAVGVGSVANVVMNCK